MQKAKLFAESAGDALEQRRAAIRRDELARILVEYRARLERAAPATTAPAGAASHQTRSRLQ